MKNSVPWNPHHYRSTPPNHPLPTIEVVEADQGIIHTTFSL
jgi:hypothetical protein